MQKYEPPRLEALFVYDPTLSTHESTEHEKILFYWPNEAQGKKQGAVGLAEALVNFTRTFSPDRPCESMHLQKSRHVFVQVERNVWFCMIVRNPKLIRTSSEGKGKEGPKTTETWLEEQISDELLRAVLVQTYESFRLFNGRIASIVAQFSVVTLRQKLDLFLPPFIQTLDLGQLTLDSVYRGLRFLAVDTNVYLRVQCFVSAVLNVFPSVRQTCILFDEQVVWTGLDLRRMRILYPHIVHRVRQACGTSRSVDAAGTLRHTVPEGVTRFVIGPETLNDPDSPINTKQVFVAKAQAAKSVQRSSASAVTGQALASAAAGASSQRPADVSAEAEIKDAGSKEVLAAEQGKSKEKQGQVGETDDDGEEKEEEEEALFLVVHQQNRVTTVFLVDGSGVMDLAFYQRLHNVIQAELRVLGKLIADNHGVVRPSGYQYLYINTMTLAVRNSLAAVTAAAPNELWSLVHTMQTDLANGVAGGTAVRELICKSGPQSWLVARRSNQRDFFVLLDDPAASVIDIASRVDQIAAPLFGNLFDDFL